MALAMLVALRLPLDTYFLFFVALAFLGSSLRSSLNAKGALL